jgi:hypothetical protein
MGAPMRPPAVREPGRDTRPDGRPEGVREDSRNADGGGAPMTERVGEKAPPRKDCALSGRPYADMAVPGREAEVR